MNKGMNIALWIVQVLLALAFGMIGGMKLFGSLEEMATNPGAEWVLEMPWLVRFIGLSEVAGAIGLILPAATRIKPMLTPIAAAGLVVIMILAALLHAVRAEWSSIATCVVFGAMAAFVVWGRSKKAPIAPR
jgi:uncharacterized membrane protein YphA (DoxX/SURF4 family)